MSKPSIQIFKGRTYLSKEIFKQRPGEPVKGLNEDRHVPFLGPMVPLPCRPMVCMATPVVYGNSRCLYMLSTFPHAYDSLLKSVWGGTWVAQLVKCLPSAQVMIAEFQD